VITVTSSFNTTMGQITEMSGSPWPKCLFAKHDRNVSAKKSDRNISSQKITEMSQWKKTGIK